MNRKQVSLSIWTVLFLTILVVGCTESVAPEDIYQYSPEYPQESGARNIAVEQTANGTKISGPEISLLFLPPTRTSFKVDVEPEGASVKYKVNKMPLDGNTGAFYMQVVITLGEDSSVPAQIPMQGASFFAPELYGPLPDALGSQDITVKINEQVGHTRFAGLEFRQEAVLGVWEDGTVEVDREGVEASDESGTAWISKEVKVEDKVAIIMIRK
ncbi:MAG: hypothetical protein PVH17_01575 [Anaerolineae bacterium]|jgi:hypothetical protein